MKCLGDKEIINQSRPDRPGDSLNNTLPFGPSDDPISEAKIKSSEEKWKKIEGKRNKSFLSQPISQVGYHLACIRHMFPPVEPPFQVKKALFPRSVVYEIAYRKKQRELKIAEGLRKQREALALKVKLMSSPVSESKQQSSTQPNDDYKTIKHENEPFWYQDEKIKEEIAPRSTKEYDADKGNILERPDEISPQEAVGLDQPKNYIPGEISGLVSDTIPPEVTLVNNESGKNQQEPFSLNQNKPKNECKYITLPASPSQTQTDENMKKFKDECKGKPDLKQEIPWFPLDYMGKRGARLKRPWISANYVFGQTDFKGNPCKDFPGLVPKLNYCWGDNRAQEFLKVGKPFKTEATRWLECSLPAFDKNREIAAINTRLEKRLNIKIN